MEHTDPLVQNPLENISMKYKIPMEQVKTTKASTMHRLVQVFQRVGQQSYSTACRLFSCSLDILLCRHLSMLPASDNRQTPEKPVQAVALHSSPSTILIVNISNSTLIDCVIGNDTYSSAVTDSQPLMKEPEPQIHDHTWCCNSHDQEETADISPPVPPPPLQSLPPVQPHSINIQGSSLKCVIFGDGNYMYTEDETS